MLPSPKWIAEATNVDLAKPSATTKNAAQYIRVAKDGTVTSKADSFTAGP